MFVVLHGGEFDRVAETTIVAMCQTRAQLKDALEMFRKRHYEHCKEDGALPEDSEMFLWDPTDMTCSICCGYCRTDDQWRVFEMDSPGVFEYTNKPTEIWRVRFPALCYKHKY